MGSRYTREERLGMIVLASVALAVIGMVYFDRFTDTSRPEPLMQAVELPPPDTASAVCEKNAGVKPRRSARSQKGSRSGRNDKKRQKAAPAPDRDPFNDIANENKQ